MSSDSPDRPLPSWANPEGPSESVTEALKALQTYKKKDGEKVIVRFKAVGNAPIMKQNFFKITSSNRFQAVIQFLRKELSWKAGEPLHTYINLAFSPAPDDTVSNLFKVRLAPPPVVKLQPLTRNVQSFATDGHLIVNYSTTAAWG
ncbi:APG12-domain-containing protein [Armillaria novae-zelandiae]|uniref:Ubiquitin-like protein ATG12 n=1 Tax=Armillaria novae-zelandiae TaxID=153914 RepID=A0AA39NVT2_9AGAR|nr:APG12-domain-containing protein [Armillaria novae-zelandiae]